MPTRAEALRFVGDARTTAAQLRRACALLGVDADGDEGALRDRLLAHLGGVEAQAPVVCLNPGPPAPPAEEDGAAQARQPPLER